jgi:hypothetical protein
MPIVDASTTPDNATSLWASIVTRLPPRPCHATAPRPTAISVVDETPFHMQTHLSISFVSSFCYSKPKLPPSSDPEDPDLRLSPKRYHRYRPHRSPDLTGHPPCKPTNCSPRGWATREEDISMQPPSIRLEMTTTPSAAPPYNSHTMTLQWSLSKLCILLQFEAAKKTWFSFPSVHN